MSKDIPAFPVPFVFSEIQGLKYSYDTGMTLRDYFANTALLVVLQQSSVEFQATIVDMNRPLSDYTDLAYRLADAMLAQREKANGATQ